MQVPDYEALKMTRVRFLHKRQFVVSPSKVRGMFIFQTNLVLKSCMYIPSEKDHNNLVTPTIKLNFFWPDT